MADLYLYGAAYCHLCEEMRAALAPLATELNFTVHWVEIDEHPQLEDQFREKIPVLVYQEQEICHYHLDEQALRSCLNPDVSSNGRSA